MALVWQCARCGATDSGASNRREGQQPPQTWLRIYVPVRGSEGAKSHQMDVICDLCEDSLYEWFREAKS